MSQQQQCQRVGWGLFAAKESMLYVGFGGMCSKYLIVPMTEIDCMPLALVCYCKKINIYL